MIRRALATGIILLAGGLVVAMVTAQETERQQRSVLARPPQTTSPAAEAREPASGTLEERGSTTARPELVDRLKKIRRNVNGGGDSTPTPGSPGPPPQEATRPHRSPIAGPVAVNPAKQRPAPPMDMHPEPNLLPAEAEISDHPTGSGLSSGLRRSPAAATNITDDRPSARREHEPPLAEAPRLAPPSERPTPAAPPRPAPSLESSSESSSESSGASSPAPASRPSRGPGLTFQTPEISPSDRRLAHRPQRDTVETAEGDTPVLNSTTGAALRVDTLGPQAILIGREADYTITLTNQSSIAANDVYVRVVIPVWVDIASSEASLGTTQVRGAEMGGQQLVWSANQLAAGGRETLTLSLIPRENRPFHLAVDWTQRPATAVAEIMVQQPQLEMAVFGPREIQYGETAVYTIQLANPGTGIAEGVTVDFGYGNELLPTREIGDLAAGQQKEIRVELTARQAGLLQVAASAAAAGGLRSEANEQVLVRRAKLDVAVAGVARKFAGSVATYEIRVRNVGDAAATDVTANIALPPGAEFIPQDQDAKLENNVVSRQLGTIAPDSERSFRIACQLTSAGDNLIEARSMGSGDLLAIDTFVTHVETLADLKLVVNDPKGPTAVGTDAIYEVKIINRGTKAARDVQIVAKFAEGIEPIDATGSGARIVPGQVLFHPINRLDPGEELQLKIVARADREGNHRFRAEVKYTDPDTVLVAEESTYFFGDDLSTARSPRGAQR